jgi:hypothetical protein
VTRRACLLLPFAYVAPARSVTDAHRKLALIEAGRLPRGTRIELTPAELSAYAAAEAPPGVRRPVLSLSSGSATGTALIDFGVIRRASGQNPGWLLGKLLDGERPVSVTARIRSSGGQATVDVERVEISGLTIEGGALDFLIQHVLLPHYPAATISRPFELGHRIERLDVQPAAVGVVIGR